MLPKDQGPVAQREVFVGKFAMAPSSAAWPIESEDDAENYPT